MAKSFSLAKVCGPATARRLCGPIVVVCFHRTSLERGAHSGDRERAEPPESIELVAADAFRVHRRGNRGGAFVGSERGLVVPHRRSYAVSVGGRESGGGLPSTAQQRLCLSRRRPGSRRSPVPTLHRTAVAGRSSDHERQIGGGTRQQGDDVYGLLSRRIRALRLCWLLGPALYR